MVPTDTDALYPYSTRAYGVVESAVAPIAVVGSTVTTISSASSKLQSLFFIVPSFHFIILKFYAFIFPLFLPAAHMAMGGWGQIHLARMLFIALKEESAVERTRLTALTL